MRSSREAIEARRNDILFKLTSNPGVIFSCRDLKDEFNLSDNTFYHDMEVLKKANTYIVMNAGKVFYDIPVREVEKTVEVVKEVPAYVVKETPATVDTTGMLTQDEVDLLLAQQRAEIYEECFKLVTRGK